MIVIVSDKIGNIVPSLQNWWSVVHGIKSGKCRVKNFCNKLNDEQKVNMLVRYFDDEVKKTLNIGIDKVNKQEESSIKDVIKFT